MTGRRRAVLTFKSVFCGPVAAGMADGLDAIVAGWRPDVMVREDLEFGSSLVAEGRGIPLVTIQATAWRPRMRDLAVEPLNLLREQRGLAPDPELRALHGSIFFTTRPASLRNPDEPMPAGTTELRPIADDRRPGDAGATRSRPATDAREWLRRWARSMADRSGSCARSPRGRAGRRGCRRGARRTAVDVRGGPGRVDVREYVPMSELLPAADVVAFHGRSGTMLAAAAAGVPMLIVRLAADQPDNGDRCVAAGIASVLSLETLGATVRASIVALLADPQYRQRAAAVAAEIAAMPDRTWPWNGSSASPERRPSSAVPGGADGYARTRRSLPAAFALYSAASAAATSRPRIRSLRRGRWSHRG